MEQRVAQRRKSISISIVNLHSKEYNSFHPHLEVKKAWELLTRLSKEAWIDKTKENAINIFNALDEFGVPFKIEPDDFLAPNSVLQIGINPNRIDILTDVDGLTFRDVWKNKQAVEFYNIKAFSLEINNIIKNKEASNRPKDRLDLVQLKELSQLR